MSDAEGAVAAARVCATKDDAEAVSVNDVKIMAVT